MMGDIHGFIAKNSRWYDTVRRLNGKFLRCLKVLFYECPQAASLVLGIDPGDTEAFKSMEHGKYERLCGSAKCVFSLYAAENVFLDELAAKGAIGNRHEKLASAVSDRTGQPAGACLTAIKEIEFSCPRVVCRMNDAIAEALIAAKDIPAGVALGAFQLSVTPESFRTILRAPDYKIRELFDCDIPLFYSALPPPADFFGRDVVLDALSKEFAKRLQK